MATKEQRLAELKEGLKLVITPSDFNKIFETVGTGHWNGAIYTKDQCLSAQANSPEIVACKLGHELAEWIRGL